MLADEVLQNIAANLYSYQDSGIGIFELSHRSKLYERIYAELEQNLKDILALPPDYSIALPTGGATNQYSMLAMNLLQPGEFGSYLISGIWAEGAYKECLRLRSAEIAASTKEQGFRELPLNYQLSEESKYLHFTANNTIVGSEYQQEPDPGAGFLVGDLSSNILSKPLDVSKYGLIYAGAQKNAGTAGVTLVIIRNDLLESIPEELPIMFDYRTYTKYKSAYNTPPTFAVYVMGEVFKWIKKMGGLEYFAQFNSEKAKLIYSEIDRSDFYRAYVKKEQRSNLNITFNLPTPELEAEFIKEAQAGGFDGLNGHRLLGGIRVSMYNAFPLQGAKDLAQFMRNFANR